jgi:hypothetical protein
MSGERDDDPGAGDARRPGGGTPDPDREVKRDIYIADISARLRYACRHLSDNEFARLVFDMAEMKLRFASIDAASWPDPRS